MQKTELARLEQLKFRQGEAAEKCSPWLRNHMSSICIFWVAGCGGWEEVVYQMPPSQGTHRWPVLFSCFFGRLALSFLSSSFVIYFFFPIVPVFSKSSPRVFPGGSDSKASAYNVGDLGSIPGSGKSPAEGNGNPLQYSCLENPMDGGTW